ncbi:MAG: hypothetical protein MZV65_38950 [Chromatiales bacterium]|nr:hypothetical protein [Chromatiales bacterium]
MADKFLTINAGRRQLVEATVVSAGAASAGKMTALGNDGRFDLTVMPVGIGPDTKSVVASEALSAGNLVNIWNETGTPKARKADATVSGKEAVGFVLSGASSGASALVYFEGVITGLSGLTAGTRYYLATTAGGTTATAPSASGNVCQYIGTAISATEITFEPDDGVIM